MLASNQIHAAKAASNKSINRLIGLLFVVVIGFSALCAYILLEARSAAWERAAEVAASLVSTIENDVSRNIEIADLSLQSVVENLNNPAVSRLDPQTRRGILFNRSAAVRQLGTIMVFDEKGNVTLDSRTEHVPSLNMADRDYFQVHKVNPAAGLSISRPMKTRLTGQWIVGLSRRLSHPDGSFAGVVMASLRLTYFQQLFQQAVLGPNGNITLSRDDGVVLMRWPYQADLIGSDISHAKLYEYLPKARAGRFETFAATDGVHRLIVYSQIGEFPLVVGVGQSTADIYAHWRAHALRIAVVVAVLTATILLLATYLFRELNRRRRAESRLAVQAMTDSLTKLSNRRHFNETFGADWDSAMRARAPISLIMIDADKFKSYNDTFGHQAGDALLKTIGAAIADSAKHDNDLGARYGGDEFALLLPETSAERAKTVEQAIRSRFMELCQQGGIVPSGLSFGIACMVPPEGGAKNELVEAADRALYHAKRRGRDRTEMAPGSEPDSAPPLDQPRAA